MGAAKPLLALQNVYNKTFFKHKNYTTTALIFLIKVGNIATYASFTISVGVSTLHWTIAESLKFQNNIQQQ